jgi:hypothetical protein
VASAPTLSTGPSLLHALVHGIGDCVMAGPEYHVAEERRRPRQVSNLRPAA